MEFWLSGLYDPVIWTIIWCIKIVHSGKFNAVRSLEIREYTTLASRTFVRRVHRSNSRDGNELWMNTGKLTGKSWTCGTTC
jgi:hypothetical protein